MVRCWEGFIWPERIATSSTPSGLSPAVSESSTKASETHIHHHSSSYEKDRSIFSSVDYKHSAHESFCLPSYFYVTPFPLSYSNSHLHYRSSYLDTVTIWGVRLLVGAPREAVSGRMQIPLYLLENCCSIWLHTQNQAQEVSVCTWEHYNEWQSFTHEFILYSTWWDVAIC